MCGICGIVAFGGSASDGERRAAVDGMIRALRHRGPDALGQSGDARARLGIARLAIRGLADGNQPVVDAASGVTVVCNGEIDNHDELRLWLRAHGREAPEGADVAVLPGLYLELGAAFVDRLVGAFAIAVWDPRNATLLLARDRAGERSLFYRIDGGGVAFASELAAFADLPGDCAIDGPALRHFLQYGFFVGGATPLGAVGQVGPAEILAIDAEGLTRRQYWRWMPKVSHDTDTSEAAFDSIFRQAVARQSEVDVDHGIFLSGGVDSSLIAAVAAAIRPGKALKAYTLRFAEDSFDEGNWASRVADALGLEAVAVDVEPAAFPAALADLIEHCGEPLADPAWIPTALLARRAARDVKVALVGEGADELFGGYPTYIGALAARHYGRIPGPLRAAFRQIVRHWPVSDKKVAVSYLVKRFAEAAELDPLSRHRAWTSSIAPPILERLGLEPVAARLPDTWPEGEEVLDAVQRHDFERSLAEGLLTKADRAGMRWALETRAPFLDVAVMEFAAALPQKERLSGLTTKVFLKRYAERYLPKEVVHRRKRGLSVPLNRWLRGPLQGWAEARLTSPMLAGAGVDVAAAAELLEEHCTGRADHARALWTLIVATEWLAWRARRCGQAAADNAGRRTARI
jgi:asparagine synthase (glutamine-hydrolysing)